MRAEFMAPIEIDTLMLIAGSARRRAGVTIIGYDPYRLLSAEQLEWVREAIRARDEELASVKFVLAARDEELANVKPLLAAREMEIAGLKQALSDRSAMTLLTDWGRAGARLAGGAARRVLRRAGAMGARVRPPRGR